ncbi:hypothetical protein HOLleu_02007 [Holothuria leucospilota]|uniref:Uncharacterized protein n=1 Tax=Holothuria leucospilota TaxID=206669 RepID=A0A9Q1CR13_HOLLE|nr:hypothetical protein HOLleu_02007 [Holothuria leucospilota]
MGNTHTSHLFALTAPNAAYEIQHQSLNTSFSTGADYVSSLSMLSNLDKFKITRLSNKHFDIQNAFRQTWFPSQLLSARCVQNHNTRETYDLVNAGAIVLVAVEYENLSFQPNASHLGYIHFM